MWIEISAVTKAVALTAVIPFIGYVDWNETRLQLSQTTLRHTLHRVCGLKSLSGFEERKHQSGHTLHRVCGLKFGLKSTARKKGLVIPFIGYVDWNGVNFGFCARYLCHTLHRVCGLKSHGLGTSESCYKVIPFIGYVDWNVHAFVNVSLKKCHTLHRVCGLKLLCMLCRLRCVCHTLHRVCGLKFTPTNSNPVPLRSYPS